MACLQHSVEGYFIPSPARAPRSLTSLDRAQTKHHEATWEEEPALWAPVPLEALPHSARLTLSRLTRLRLATVTMAVYFIVVMIVERNAEFLGSAVG